MTNLLTDPTFKIYAICAIVLIVQMMFLSGYTGAVRGKHKSFANPEDGKLSPDTKPPDAEHPAVARVIRTHRNGIENLPLFFTIGLIAVLAGVNPMGAQVCFIAFAVARVLHMICQLKGAQPWRSMMYGIGMLSMLGLLVMTGMKLAA
jgi:microsomal prostaglandin-E synthase 1